MKTTTRMVPALLALTVGGCGTVFDYDDLRSIDARGRDFNAALTREYKALALDELDAMQDLLDAHRFRKKAMAAAAAETPAPDRLDERTLPYRTWSELTAARARLVQALEKGGGHFMPEPAARAQVRFDCWLEQQEEDFQPDDIQKCRDGFYAALITLERALADREGTGASAKATKVAAALPAVPVRRPSAFTLLFEFDKAEVTAEHFDALDAVVEAAKAGGAVRLVVGGHADRAGPEPYNLALSKRRAEAIERALVGRGLARDSMTVVAYGERRTRVATPNGVREALNRRVEIVIGASPSL